MMLFKLLRANLRVLREILNTLIRMEAKINNMATKSDLENAIASVNTAVQQLGADLVKVIADLQAKIDAGAPPADFQPEVDSLNGIATAVAGFDAQAQAADGVPPAENQTA